MANRTPVHRAVATALPSHCPMSAACADITMPKDILHFGGVEHRDIHNQ
jgi:hypothetical protein